MQVEILILIVTKINTMKKFLLLVCMIACYTAAFAQSVTLTFTAKDAANQHVQLNRVSITNLTKGWQETIYWPDTTLTMQNGTGIADVETHRGTSLQLSQNNPNPFIGTTEVSLMVAEEGEVMVEISDITGRVVETQCIASLQAGTCKFRVTLSTVGTYVMTARQNGQTSSIKMVCNGGGNGNRIEYTGNGGNASYACATQPKSGSKYNTSHPFTFGDQMEYVGYAVINGSEMESDHISQVQNASQSFVLQFDVSQAQDGQPCPGAATVTDIDNNTYNTVQIGNQCWMKENLRTMRYANGTSIPLGTSTSTITSYRYNPNNNANNVPTYGYLYNWPAVMHGASSSSSNPSGVQGICPNGWHVPSDAEWTQLTNFVSSQSQYQCGSSSSNIAKALASTKGWNSSTNNCAVGNNSSTNNATGFSALPAGYYTYGLYDDFGYCANFWSATEYGNYDAYGRYLDCDYAYVYRNFSSKNFGFSVRCVRD